MISTATASASDRACRESRQSPQSDAPELRRIFRRESGALQHVDGLGEQPGIATDARLLPQPLIPPLTRTAHQVAGEYCHTRPAHLTNPHSPLESRRLIASRLLKQPRPDLLPRDDIRWILLLPVNSVIKLRPLRIRQGHRVRLQAFPDGIQQFRLFRSGQAIYLASQIAHNLITLARFLRTGKH